jgi:hypothetical protein
MIEGTHGWFGAMSLLPRNICGCTKDACSSPPPNRHHPSGRAQPAPALTLTPTAPDPLEDNDRRAFVDYRNQPGHPSIGTAVRSAAICDRSSDDYHGRHAALAFASTDRSASIARDLWPVGPPRNHRASRYFPRRLRASSRGKIARTLRSCAPLRPAGSLGPCPSIGSAHRRNGPVALKE